MTKLECLDQIAGMVKPLNPPVQAFETSIRETPYRILISVMLSSRTKDVVTHKASGQLFDVADSPQKMKLIPEEEIARLIFPVGFYKQKAKQIKVIAEKLSAAHPRFEKTSGVPDSLEELTALPGVGRKTANLVMALAFNIPAIAVDIHVFRISKRLGWAFKEKPEQVEEELMKNFPPQQWNRINQTLVGFGQTLCKPVGPSCDKCCITKQCLFFSQEKPPRKKKKIKSAGAST